MLASLALSTFDNEATQRAEIHTTARVCNNKNNNDVRQAWGTGLTLWLRLLQVTRVHLIQLLTQCETGRATQERARVRPVATALRNTHTPAPGTNGSKGGEKKNGVVTADTHCTPLSQPTPRAVVASFPTFMLYFIRTAVRV